MKLQVITTITTLIDIDTFETQHSVEITPEPGVPESIARAAAVGGCRATLNTLDTEVPKQPAPSPYRDDIGGNGL